MDGTRMGQAEKDGGEQFTFIMYFVGKWGALARNMKIIVRASRGRRGLPSYQQLTFLPLVRLEL